MFEELKNNLLTNGETITYRDSETVTDKEVLVLIHGNMSSSFHFNQVFEKFSDDYRIIAPDMRGFGGSSYITPFNSLRELANDIGELLKNLSISKATVLGWSTGGGVAMELAIIKPELVSKLILVESVGITGYPMFKKDEQGQPIIGDFIVTKEEIAADPVQVLPVLTAINNRDKETFRAIWNALIYTNSQPEAELYELYLQDMLTQRNLVDIDYALVHFNISDTHNGVVEGTNEIQNINIPTLIFQGDRDYVVPKTMGDGIYEKLKSNGIYKTGDWGHSPFVDCLDMLSDEILNFLRM